MNQKITIISAVILLWSTAQNISGQQLVPTVGSPLPEFVLANVSNFNSQTINNSDLRGKWAVLDFWFLGCKKCIQSMPDVNEIQGQFKNELTWILVGANDRVHNRGIEALYKRLEQKQHLTMINAFDSVLVSKWEIYSMPHIIIADPNGIVRFITGGRDMTSEKIQLLIKGQDVSFFPKDNEMSDFNAQNASAAGPNVYNTIYQNTLVKWKNEKQSGHTTLHDFMNSYTAGDVATFDQAMIPLFGLFDLAYFGSWYWSAFDSLYGNALRKPVLEMRDTTLFQYDYASHGTIFGVYNYHLQLPPGKVTKAEIMRQMQETLRVSFAQNARLEKRNAPYFALVSSPRAAQQLKTKHSIKFLTEGSKAAGFVARNCSTSELLRTIQYYIDDYKRPFIDETGIKSNIDLTIDADMSNRSDVIKQLQKNGLDLVIKYKPMTVLVITDDVSQ
jgi:thiol-disulfide isomerase/thioredoxin